MIEAEPSPCRPQRASFLSIQQIRNVGHQELYLVRWATEDGAVYEAWEKLSNLLSFMPQVARQKQKLIASGNYFAAPPGRDNLEQGHSEVSYEAESNETGTTDLSQDMETNDLRLVSLKMVRSQSLVQRYAVEVVDLRRNRVEELVMSSDQLRRRFMGDFCRLLEMQCCDYS